MFFWRKRKEPIVVPKLENPGVSEELDRLAQKYNLDEVRESFEEKQEIWSECYGKVCTWYREKKIFIYAGDCEFDYFMTLYANDGPQYTARIIFGTDENNFYKIGVCVRGEPLFWKIDIGSKDTKRTIRSLWGKTGAYFEDERNGLRLLFRPKS